MQITLDPLELTKEQREQLAGFILTFGAAEQDRETSRQAATFDRIIAGSAIEPTPNPADVFKIAGEPVLPAPAPISQSGPVLVIPPAPTSAQNDAVIERAFGLDKKGFPWDERIHSSSKALNADGTWRAKRGVNEITVQEVEAELRKLTATPTTPVPAPAPTLVPVLPAIPPPPPAAAPDVDLRAQFVALVGRASAAIQQGRLSQDELLASCAMAGVASLQLLATNMALVPQVAEQIDTLLASRPQ